MDTSIRSEQLQAGRRALQATGKSPRQVGQERARTALTWIYRWGWSSPATIELLTGGNRGGLAAKLVRRGLLSRTKTESGGGHRDVPAYILTLTEAGVQEVERWLTDEAELLPYDTDPYRVNQSLLRHDTMAQTATARALQNRSIQAFLTERQMAARSRPGIKQPDVVWLQRGDEEDDQWLRFAVEVELSAKWSRDLDQFVHACVTSLTGDQPRFHQIILITDSPAIKARYENAFRPGSQYDLWERDPRRHWHVVDTTTVPDTTEGRFLCRLVNRS